MIILKGSLRSHWIQYITSIDMNVNPADIPGSNLSFKFYRLMNTLDTKYIQPGFQFNHKMNWQVQSYYQPSILHLKWVNGYERKYSMGTATWEDIKKEIEYINRHVEFERMLEGQDDEFEDEM